MLSGRTSSDCWTKAFGALAAKFHLALPTLILGPPYTGQKERRGAGVVQCGQGVEGGSIQLELLMKKAVANPD
jgi:hypothetical protein